MRWNRITLLLPLALGSLLIAPAIGSPVLGAASLGCTADTVTSDMGGSSNLALGKGFGAVLGDQVLWIDEQGRRQAYLNGGSPGALIRHPATAPGRGAAFVEDLKGPDSVTVVGPGGVQRIVAGGEATHPAWGPDGSLAWVEDLRRVAVRIPGGGMRLYPRPEGTSSVFSPVFTGPGVLLAVVEETVPGSHTAGDQLDNLYSLDLGSGAWTRLTSFTLGSHDWSIIRTPLRTGTGSVLFVRIHGSDTASRVPAFELWTLADGAVKVRDLPGEAYLASGSGDGIVWNVFGSGEWRLFLEDGSGVRDLGCGAVNVDPRAQIDPDKGHEAPGPMDPTTPLGEPGASELAIAVGDFSTPAQAEAVRVAMAIPAAIVIDHPSAPSAVAPGAFAVAIPLPEEADLMGSLDAFRERFPTHAERSWIVTLSGRAS